MCCSEENPLLLNKRQVDEFDEVEILGRGGFARVSLVRLANSEEHFFAMKIIDKTQLRTVSQREHALSERRILLSCHCDFIVRSL